MSVKRALVTGSTQGIGKAVAKKLIENGCEVIVHCSGDIEKARGVQRELGAFGAVVADLSDAAETRSLYEQTGPVDILILNASVQIKQDWQQIDYESMEKQWHVNVASTLMLIQAYYPAMKEKGFGRIITLGSVNQHRCHPELPFYSATKCAVMSLVRNIAKKAAPYRVTVNNVAPGAVLTPRNKEVHDNPEKYRKFCKNIPLGRFAEADEIASTVAFIAGDEADYITGADIVIDGGLEL